MAFKFANGAVKELEMLVPVQCTCKEWLEVEAKTEEVKCEKCNSVLTLGWPEGEKMHDEMPCAVIEAVRPYGGAQSFSDVDTWRESLDLDANVQDQKRIFDSIWDNVWADLELSILDKRQKVGQALVDLASRITNPPEGRRSLIDKVKGFFTQKDDDDFPELESEAKAAVPSHKGAISQQATWDGAAAIRRARRFSSSGNTGKKEDMNWATYARFFATVDPANRESFGGYGYPHHDVEGGRMVAVRGGVRAAFQRARQQNAADAIRHLQPHREQFGFRESSFVVTKDLAGAWRWLAIHTNKFEDEEGEGFAEEAHKEYEAWIDETGNYPELRLWHVKGSRIGVADLVTYADGFVLSSGVFDPGCEEAAKALAEMQGGLGVSHGFYYPEDSLQDGFYQWYRTFEISPLPQEHAANLWTEFSAAHIDRVKEVSMSLDPSKKEYLVKVVGQERADSIEAALPKFEKELEESGVAFKDFADSLASDDSLADAAGEDADSSESGAATSAAGDEPKAGDGNDGDDNEDESAAGEEGSLAKRVEEQVVAGVRAVLAETVDGRLKAIEDRLVEVEKSFDEKVAAAMAPKGPANRPSQSDDTALDGKAAEDIKAALNKATEGGDELPVNPATPYVEDMARVLRGRT
jgi:hypothetical protein